MIANYSTTQRVQSCVQSSVVDRRLGPTVRLAFGSYRVADYFYDSEKSFRRIDECFMKATSNPMSTIEILSFAGSLSTIAGELPLAQRVNNSRKANFFAKSLMVPEKYPPSRSAMEAYFTYIIENGKKLRDQYLHLPADGWNGQPDSKARRFLLGRIKSRFSMDRAT